MGTTGKAKAERRRPTKQPVARTGAGGRLTRTAWVPTGELGFDDWSEHGRRLGVIGRASAWWLGDWLRYGNAEFGERYTRASRITGYDAQTLMNMVYVATAVPQEERRESLSWSHHAELAALSPEHRAEWLDKTEGNRLSVRCLRAELRQHTPRPVDRVEVAVPDERESLKRQCPHCGRDLTA